jgi:hypothetical protein
MPHQLLLLIPTPRSASYTDGGSHNDTVYRVAAKRTEPPGVRMVLSLGQPVFLLFRSLQQQAPPGATLHCWRLQVLVGNSTAQSPGWRQAELEADVRRVLQPVVVVSHDAKSLRCQRNVVSGSSHVPGDSRSRLRCTCSTAEAFQQHSAAPSANTSLLKEQTPQQQHRVTVSQECHEGAHAAALAGYWGVERLPGAVLLPPFCHAATCEVRQHQRPGTPAQWNTL